MPVRNSIAALKEEIAGYRRALHEHPQTAYEEVFASDFVAGKLSEWGIAHERGLAGTGIVATIKGRHAGSGKSIGLRADIDALDILEKSGQPWASKTPGKMHGCGHDGHTAMLLGAARHLHENPDFDGTVHLIFQPAEEGERGAHRMIEEGLFEKFPCDSVYGLHNWPWLPLGTIAVHNGPVMASIDRADITVTGRGGHAAYPHKCVDPLVAGSAIVLALQTIVSREFDPVEAGVVSVTNFNAGTGAENVIGDTAKLVISIRSLKPETRALLKKRIAEIAQGTAAAHGASAQVNYTPVADPTVNHAKDAALCAQVARKVSGEVLIDPPPSMGAEDFGAMLAEKPGCYIWLGQGLPEDAACPHSHGLHSPFYDFNDEAIPLGIEYWVSLVETAMPPGKR